MKRFLIFLVLVVVIAGVVYGLSKSPRYAGKFTRVKEAIHQKFSKKVDWTPDKIAADPEGYLIFAEKSVQQRIREREEKLASLAKRKVEIEDKSNTFNQNLKEVENLRERLATASRRADDEDRWPVQVGGKEFDRATANAVLASSKQYIEERRPLASAYTDATRRLSATEESLRIEQEKLIRLKDKVAVDLERVRLNKGMAELEQLKQTEAELAALSTVLADMNTDPIAGVSLPSNEGSRTVDLEQLLKKK